MCGACPGRYRRLTQRMLKEAAVDVRADPRRARATALVTGFRFRV
jgi:hypothetical protein